MDKYIKNNEQYLKPVEKLSDRELILALQPCAMCVREKATVNGCQNKESCRYMAMWKTLLKRKSIRVGLDEPDKPVDMEQLKQYFEE